MRSYHHYLSIGALLLSLVATGCGTTSPTEQRTTNPIIDDSSGTVSNGIPSNFPTDIPRYPNATLRVATSNETQTSATLLEDANADLTAVKAKLNTSFQDTGFTATILTDTSDLYLATYNKNNVQMQVRCVYDTQQHITNIFISRTSN